MKTHGIFKRIPNNESGVALIIAMGMLVLLTLLALAFASSQITESKATWNFYYASIAEQLAKGGLDHAIALLKWDQDQTNVPVATPGFDSYFDRWGYLNNTGADGFETASPSTAQISLHPDYPIGAGANDDARWIEVKDPNNPNVVIGQYAVFVEDEASKLNINTAGNVINTTPGSAPLPSTYDDDDPNDYGVTSISPLRLLYELYTIWGKANTADDILDYKNSYGGFITPSEVAFINGLTEKNFVDDLQYYFTVYSKGINRYYDAGWNDCEDFDAYITAGNAVGLFTWLQTKGIIKDSAGNLVPDNQLKQIAVNIIDFFDNDDIPTRYAAEDIYGIEKTVYINEVDAEPEYQPFGDGRRTKDWGNYIEIYNPYSVSLQFQITIGSVIVPSTSLNSGQYFLIWDNTGTIETVPGSGVYDGNHIQGHGAADVSGSFDLTGGTKVELKDGAGNTIEIVTCTADDNKSMSKNDPRVRVDSAGTLNKMDLGARTIKAQNNIYNPGAGEGTSTFDAHEAEADKGMKSVGQLGLVHRGDQWRTINFTNPNEDLKLLDLVGPPGVAGGANIKGIININTAPDEVLVGLKSFWIMVGAPPNNRRIAHYVEDYVLNNINRPFDNLAEIMNVIEMQGDSTSDDDNDGDTNEADELEMVVRDISNVITVSSDVYRVIVLAQAFDRKGDVAAERKLEAVVDRGGKHTDAVNVLFFRWMTE